MSAPHAGPPAANHAKGQNATKPAELKKKHPQKPKPTPEHPFSHTNVPTEDPTRNSSTSPCFVPNF